MKRQILLAGAALMFAGAIQARTWNVNPFGTGDAPTIQAAVDSAKSGDVVLLADGTYREENILVDGKNITIGTSLPGGKVILLAPTERTGTGITMRNVSASGSVTSLTLIGYHTGLSIEGSSALVSFVTVKQCTQGLLVPFGVGTPTFLGCLVDSCDAGVDVQGATVRVQNSTIVYCTEGVKLTGGSTTVTRNIIYGCAIAADCAGAPGTFSCNNFFLNTTNYNGCSAGATDFYTDPVFCFLTPPSPGLFWLHSSSPCLTRTNPCGQTVGAFTSAQGCTGTPVEDMTWGKIKSLYH